MNEYNELTTETKFYARLHETKVFINEIEMF